MYQKNYKLKSLTTLIYFIVDGKIKIKGVDSKMKKITNELITKFKEYLIDEEKSAATLDKYIRDITVFMYWSNDKELCK